MTVPEDASTRAPSRPSDGATPPHGESDEQGVLARWVAQRPGRGVVVLGVALVALQALVRALPKFRGFFLVDDVSFMGRSFTMSGRDPMYYFEGWNGHFMPGAFLQVKAIVDRWPYDYVPIAISDLVIQAVLSLCMLKLLLDLFGRRPAILLPLTFYLFTPMTLPAFLWWAAGLNQLWGQLAMVLILMAQLSYLRTRRVRTGWLGVAAMAGGLLFSEKVLLMLPVVFAFSLFLFTRGSLISRLRYTVREHRRVWLGYGLVTALYLVVYKVAVTPPLGKPGALQVTVDTVITGLTDAIIPAVYGGPFVWYKIGFGAVAASPKALLLVLGLITAIAIWYSLWKRPAIWWTWVVILGYHVTNGAILGTTRATYVGPLIGAEYRYHTDTAVIIGVFAALAFLPVREVHEAQVRTGDVDSDPRRTFALGTAVVMLIVSCASSTLTFDYIWGQNPQRTFFANMQRSVALSADPITINDFPADISGYTEAWRVYSRLSPAPSFLTTGTSAARVFAPDDQGVLYEANVKGFSSPTGPEPNCGYRLGDTALRVPLDLPTMNWTWVARIDYMATYANDSRASVGKVSTPVHFEPGVHSVFVRGNGEVAHVGLEPVEFGSVCVLGVEVGNLVTVPGRTPDVVSADR